MTAKTLEAFKELQILPKDPRSQCEECKAGILHKQAACPQKGDKRKAAGKRAGGVEEGHEEQDPDVAGSGDRQGHDHRPGEVGGEGIGGHLQEEALIKANRRSDHQGFPCPALDPLGALSEYDRPSPLRPQGAPSDSGSIPLDDTCIIGQSVPECTCSKNPGSELYVATESSV